LARVCWIFVGFPGPLTPALKVQIQVQTFQSGQ